MVVLIESYNLRVMCTADISYIQRDTDRVLETLIQKTERIRRELGSLSTVLVDNITTSLGTGIDSENVFSIQNEIESNELIDRAVKSNRRTLGTSGIRRS